jgi:Protein of unknown function (DUF5131)/Protein of unknown function (DUF3102)
LKKPRLIFANSMSDFFHEKMPLETIKELFGIMGKCPRHKFQILTKRHKRLAELAPGLSWHDNIWMGVSIENQDYVERADFLRQVPAKIRFLSCEPLLGPLELNLDGIHWVLIGGESGPGYRPMDLEWARGILKQCKAAGVACFVKQLGGHPNKRHEIEKFPIDLQVQEFPFHLNRASFLVPFKSGDAKPIDQSVSTNLQRVDDDDGSEADEIILHELAEKEKQCVGSLLEIWIRTGEVLSARRARCPHGTWRPWLKAHTSYSHDTARIYIGIAKNKDRILTLSKDEPVRLLSDAYLLATEDDPETREALLQESKKTHKSIRTIVQAKKPPAQPKPASLIEKRQVTGTPPDPLLEKWQKQIQALDDPEFEEEQESMKQICEKFGLPYYLPFCLKFGGPASYSSWIDGFANFLDGLNAAPLSDQDRAHVLECMADARTFIERYEKRLLPDEPGER